MDKKRELRNKILIKNKVKKNSNWIKLLEVCKLRFK